MHFPVSSNSDKLLVYDASHPSSDPLKRRLFVIVHVAPVKVRVVLSCDCHLWGYV
jgi:hypothetical protein